MKFLALLLTLPLILFAKYEEVPDKSTLEILTKSLQGQKTGKIRLANGLEVYIISDPGAKQSAVAYCQKVGSWHDGEHAGTAHFLEHLLFLGSETYPEEDLLMNFVQENGGTPNAYTALDHTVYLYNINHSAFNESISQLSSFFICPLFNQGGIDRELNAVEQEYRLRLENDNRRQFQILKEVANPNHPNAKFGSGNKETLSKIPHGVVREWFETYYGAKNAHLVLYSNQPLEDLKALVDEKFSPIRSECVIPEETGELIAKESKGQTVYIKPLKDLKSFSILWEAPREMAHDKDNHIALLIAQSFNRESERSLFEQLKREGLIVNGSFFFEHFSVDHLLLGLDVNLTNEGVKNLSLVQERCYQAINGLKTTGIPPFIFEETNRLFDMGYKFQTRNEALAIVSKHVEGLLNEPLDTYPQKTALISRYSPSKVREALELLTPENSLTFVFAPEEMLPVKVDQTEKWTGAEFARVPLKESQISHLQSIGAHPQIGLAPPNPYIPENFDLKTVYDDQLMLLADGPDGTAYYSPESTYEVPEVSTYLSLYSPQINTTARSQAMCDLYTRTIKYLNAPFFNQVRQGGCSPNVIKHKLSLVLMLNGFSNKSEEILLDTAKLMKSLAPTKEQFEMQKTELLASYNNRLFNPPYQQALMLSLHTFNNYSHLPEQSIEALESISYEDFLSFNEKLFDQVYLKGLFTGNLTKVEAKHQWRSLSKALVQDPYPVREHASNRSLLLPSKGGPFKVKQNIQMQGNAALLVIGQGFHTFEKQAAQEVLGSAIASDFFNELRTKQQVGYVVGSRTSESDSQLMQIYMAQSTSHTPEELLVRFEIFIENFLKNIDETVSEGRFDQLKNAQIEELSEPQPNLEQKASELYTYLVDHGANFRWKEEQIEALKNLTYEQFKKDAHAFIDRSNGKRIAFLLEGTKSAELSFSYNEILLETIKNEGTYISCAE
ncbi:MAG: Protease 3 [Chlamydiia bacterium]|nr:Protease 3 [Chlamydiia bacterium]MCH9615094.1 Protease 3 [Chlamydiia bacterium]MCH9628584.1 Protease 3 [Chlamydiia bacterium]